MSLKQQRRPLPSLLSLLLLWLQEIIYRTIIRPAFCPLQKQAVGRIQVTLFTVENIISMEGRNVLQYMCSFSASVAYPDLSGSKVFFQNPFFQDPNVDVSDNCQQISENPKTQDR